MRDYVKPSKASRKLIVLRRKAIRNRDVSRAVTIRRGGQSEKFAVAR